MTPPCHAFPAAELPLRAQLDVHGRRRKLDPAQRAVDLSACQLLQMQQYNCEVVQPRVRDSPVRCVAVDRFFRRCAYVDGPMGKTLTCVGARIERDRLRSRRRRGRVKESVRGIQMQMRRACSGLRMATQRVDNCEEACRTTVTQIPE